MVTVTHVPQAAQFMEGVINLRGRLIPIIDLRTRFGMERAERTKNTRIVVTEIGTKRLGMVVDSVSEVLRIPAFAFARAPLRTARTDLLVDLRRIAGLCSAGRGRRASSPDRVHESRSGPRGRRFGVSRPWGWYRRGHRPYAAMKSATTSSTRRVFVAFEGRAPTINAARIGVPSSAPINISAAASGARTRM
jgi:hypothetical protein